MTGFMNDTYPKTAAGYLLSVIFLTVINTNPALIISSLICAVTASFLCIGSGKTVNNAKFAIPLMLFMAIITPLTNHRGMTVLFYLPWGNPMTVEAIIYGIFVSLNMAAVVFWCGVYSSVVTTDKLMALTGKIFPGVSLTVCMVSGMIPRFIDTFKKTSDHSKILRGGDETRKERISGLITVISTVITWALESGIQTSQSMRARGYGRGKRSVYLRRDESKTDKAFKYIWLSLLLLIAVLMAARAFRFDYFGYENTASLKKSLYFLPIPTAVYLLPSIFEIKERSLWK